ncbi:hypothetical protein ABHA40_13970, partial [Enterococcus mundtii]|uniref:hypothetical protein n=1 Tax=Enterococcus mundtii TaxID=53346 RepID=UPI00325BAA50
DCIARIEETTTSGDLYVRGPRQNDDVKGEPVKGILKPPLTEKLANAQEKVKANAQEKANPTLNNRPKTNPALSK